MCVATLYVCVLVTYITNLLGQLSTPDKATNICTFKTNYKNAINRHLYNHENQFEEIYIQRNIAVQTEILKSK